jgi:hypothetical protein
MGILPGKSPTPLPSQRQDQFIQLIRHLLHLALAVDRVHAEAHLAHGVAVVAGAADGEVEGVVEVRGTDFSHGSLRTLGSGWAIVALGALRTRWTSGISLRACWTLRPHGSDLTLGTFWPHRTVHSLRTLWPWGSTGITRVSLRTLRPRWPHGTFRASGTRRPRRSTGIARVSLRTHGSLWAFGDLESEVQGVAHHG